MRLLERIWRRLRPVGDDDRGGGGPYRPAGDSTPSQRANGGGVRDDVRDESRYSIRSSVLLGAPLTVLIAPAALLGAPPPLLIIVQASTVLIALIAAQLSIRGQDSGRSCWTWLRLRCWKSAAASCVDDAIKKRISQ